MGFNKKIFLLAIFIIFFVCAVCFSQSANSLSAIPIEKEMVTQTLTWDAVLYASRYEINVEQQVSDVEWETYGTYTSEKNSVNLNLRSGHYRYSVIVINVLGRSEPASEWYEFEVYRTVKPYVKSVTPDTIILNDNTDGVLLVVAENIVFNSVFTLKDSDGTILYGAVLRTDSDSVILDFDEHRLSAGEYTLSMANPGGLIDSNQTLIVKEDKTYDIGFSIGYTATALLPGGTIVPQLESTFIPLGFYVNFEWIPIKRDFGDIGFGISARSLILEQGIGSSTVNGRFFPAALYVSHIYPLIGERLYVNSSLGAGLNFFWNLYFSDSGTINREPLNAIAVLATAGTSLQFFATENLFFDISFDYDCSFFLGDTFLQMVMPSISIGLKF